MPGPRAINTAIDEYGLYVEVQDLSLLNLNATSTNSNTPNIVYATNAVIVAQATATGSQASGDLVNTSHRGLQIYADFTGMSVNSATLGVNINAKDPVSGLYLNLTRISLDGIINGAGLLGGQFGPGLPVNVQLPRVFQITATLTITTTASMTGTVNYTIGATKLL